MYYPTFCTSDVLNRAKMDADEIVLELRGCENGNVHLKSNMERTKDSDEDSIIHHVICDVQERRIQQHGERAHTLFYKIVQAGDHEHVSRILSALREQGCADDLAWLMGHSKSTAGGGSWADSKGGIANPQHMRTWVESVIAFGFFLALAILVLVISPLFYLCHAIVSYVCVRLFAKCPDPPTLPLAIVCKSRCRNMVELFQKEGLTMSETDCNHNNVIHYLATFSKDDPEGATMMVAS